MIKIENLNFYYNDALKPSLSDINLQIQDGEFIIVSGPSGSGKSSLCRCFNGLIPHFYGGKISGRIEVQGLDILKHSTRELAIKVGMIFQDPENQIVSTDVEREVAFGLENLAFPRNLIARRIEEALDTIGIFSLRHRQTQELSGGEKQKVAIASVLALYPEVLVLDEPTSELDPQSAEDVLSVVKRLNDELGITVILIEHRLDRVLAHADRIIILDQGNIAVDCNTREILDNSYQKIAEIGVGVPPIIRLTQELRGRGLGLNGHTPLTVKEARAIIRDELPETHCQLPHNEIKYQGQPLIETENVWFAYPEGATALKKINLTIHRGEFVAVMGRNASGKTTLIKHFNGLLKPLKGRVVVDGIDTRKATTAELSRKVGFVSQNPNDHLFADTVEEEVGFALKNLEFSHERIMARTDHAIARFRLGEHRQRYPRSLSGGEKQRVALASVVAVQPQILILDEPTRGMEYRLKAELMSFLHDYSKQGNTIILVTHDVEIAAEYADRVILLSEGEIVMDGATHEVLSRALLFSPQINRLVQSFAKLGFPGDILTVGEFLQVLK